MRADNPEFRAAPLAGLVGAGRGQGGGAGRPRMGS